MGINEKKREFFFFGANSTFLVCIYRLLISFFIFLYMQRSFKILSYFVLPCFIAESAYKIWWYCMAGSRIPFIGNMFVSHVIACILELCSWLYRMSIFFLVCVLFCLICHLQILRLEDFIQVFQEESDVAMVLKQHLRIRRQLKVISHRFRAFIVSTLIIVTASQLAALLVTTSSHAEVDIIKAGELAVSHRRVPLSYQLGVTWISGCVNCQQQKRSNISRTVDSTQLVTETEPEPWFGDIDSC